MLVMFSPSAVTPPSAKSRHWTIRTVETQSAPTQGPTRMAARVPPSRWPETPGQDLEVEHLHGEDERRDQPGHRRQPVVEVARGPRTQHRPAPPGRGGEERRDWSVDDPVGDVHGYRRHGTQLIAESALLPRACNNPDTKFTRRSGVFGVVTANVHPAGSSAVRMRRGTPVGGDGAGHSTNFGAASRARHPVVAAPPAVPPR